MKIATDRWSKAGVVVGACVLVIIAGCASPRSRHSIESGAIALEAAVAVPIRKHVHSSVLQVPDFDT